MNFFERQDQARAHTAKLVLLFIVAIIVLVAVTGYVIAMAISTAEAVQKNQPIDFARPIDPDLFIAAAAVIVSVVIAGAMFRLAQLRAGGQAVAEYLGGRLINRDAADLNEQKILNVVEEMAIASGIPVPPVYVIRDDAINAFAAGFHPHDAVIGITRGAIRLLSREELQGVIAHEFSHIFNGDMRLNLRLIGWLHGLLLISLVGRHLLRVRFHTSRKGAAAGAVIPLLGLALIVLGYVGVLFGNLIKSAVGRQREFLADAAAVQYTRHPEGLANALKKIGGYPLGSRLLLSDTTEVSHMLISESAMGRKAFGWFATHPPLAERVRRIDPRWNGEFIDPARQAGTSWSSIPGNDAVAAADAGHKAVRNIGALASVVVNLVGTTSVENLEAANAQLVSLPPAVKQQVATALEASLLMYGVLVAQSPSAVACKQLELLQQQLPKASFDLLSVQLELLAPLKHMFDITLLELAQPALKQLSADQLRDFLRLVTLLVEVDGEVTLQEWGFARLLRHYLVSSPAAGGRIDIKQCSEQIAILLSMLARAGNDDSVAAANVVVAACEEAEFPVCELMASDLQQFDAAITRLAQIKPLQKPRLLKSMVRCIHYDGKLSQQESDLLRIFAAVIDCPLPPLKLWAGHGWPATGNAV